MSSILRQSATGRDRFWDSGLRVAFGQRTAHSIASLTWGTLTDGSQEDDISTLPDCAPYTLGAYESFAPDAENMSFRTRYRKLSIDSPDADGGISPSFSWYMANGAEREDLKL